MQGRLYISPFHIGFKGYTSMKRSTAHFLVHISDVKDADVLHHFSTLVFKKPITLGKAHMVESVKFRGCEPGVQAVSLLLLMCGEKDENCATCSESDDTIVLTPSPDDGPDLADGIPDSMASNLHGYAEKLFNDDLCGEQYAPIYDGRVSGVSLTAFADQLSAEVWDNDSFMVAYHTALGSTNITVEALVCDEKRGSTIREIKMISPITKVPMCPETSRMTSLCEVCILPGACKETPIIRINRLGVALDAPFGNRVVVQERAEIMATDDPNIVKCIISARVLLFRKMGMLSSRIRSVASRKCVGYAAEFVALIQKRAPKNPVCAAVGVEPPLTC